MLWRLNDADISSTWCLRSGGGADSKYEACCLIYIGLIGLHCKAFVLEARGYEISPHWKSDLNSATDHFSEHLQAKMDAADGEMFDEFCLAAMIAASNDSEHRPFSDPRVKQNDRRKF